MLYCEEQCQSKEPDCSDRKLSLSQMSHVSGNSSGVVAPPLTHPLPSPDPPAPDPATPTCAGTPALNNNTNSTTDNSPGKNTWRFLKESSFFFSWVNRHVRFCVDRSRRQRPHRGDHQGEVFELIFAQTAAAATFDL